MPYVYGMPLSDLSIESYIGDFGALNILWYFYAFEIL